MTNQADIKTVQQAIADMLDDPAQMPNIARIPGEPDEEAETRLALITAKEAVISWFGSILEDHGLHHSLDRLEQSPNWTEAEDNVRYAWGVADGPQHDRIQRVISAAAHAAEVADCARKLETAQTKSPPATRATLMAQAIELMGKMNNSARKHEDPERRSRMLQKLLDRMTTAPQQSERDSEPLIFRMFRTCREQARLTITGQIQELESIEDNLPCETVQSYEDAIQALAEAKSALHIAHTALAE